MKYLLVWSFLINQHWVAGTAIFPNLYQCLEAKQEILSYKVVSKEPGAYVECRIFDEERQNSFRNWMFLKHGIDSDINKFIDKKL